MQLIQNPVPRTVSPYGLFTVTAPVTPADPHWQQGVQWETLPCRNVQGIAAWDCSDSSGSMPLGLPKNFYNSGPGVSEATAFTAYSAYDCSTGGNSVENGQRIATEQLELGEQSYVEWELWTGHLGSEPTLPGSATEVTGDDVALDPLAALAALEAWYHGHYGTANGMLGYVHMGVGAATILAKRGALQYRSNAVYTAVGSRVIIGTGYGSAALDDDGIFTDRLYITPPLFIYRSEIFTGTDTPEAGMDLRHNDLLAVAERNYLVGWDDCPESGTVQMAWCAVPDCAEGGLPSLPPFTIDSPADGAAFDPGTVTFTGQGTPGQTVTVNHPSGAVFNVETTVEEDGSWTADLTFAGADDVQNLTVTADQGLRTAAVDIVINANPTDRQLRITSPANNDTIAADQAIEVTGTGGDPAHPISCVAVDGSTELTRENDIVADADGNWTTTLDGTPWDPAGGYVSLQAEDDDPDSVMSNTVNLEVTS